MMMDKLADVIKIFVYIAENSVDQDDFEDTLRDWGEAVRESKTMNEDDEDEV